MVDSPLTLQVKEGNIVREKYELTMLSDLVKTKSEYTKSRSNFLLQEIKNTT